LKTFSTHLNINSRVEQENTVYQLSAFETFTGFDVENIHLIRKVGVIHYMTVDGIKSKNKSIKEEDFKDALVN